MKTLLASQYPMVLTWGPEFTQIYNDAYAKFIGDRHPAALGNDIRVTLAESWDVLGPMINEVMKSGIANWTPALLLRLERSGYPEESYFSVSHAPVEDDAGEIVGMLAVCSEVTQQLLEGLAAGADDYLVKPFGARELLARLDGAVRLARMRAEREGAQRELKIKEAMLSEINHRVKNNLQFISSLLSFTAKEITDPHALARLEALKARVMNLGAIHNLLYETDTTIVDAEKFIPPLCREIQAAFGMDRISFSINVEPLALPIDRTIPLGLLVNEAVLNCSKHAFEDIDEPEINVALTNDGNNQARLAISDNGKGIDGFRSGSSGMRLMQAFAGQLGGRLSVQNSRGTMIEVEFPVVRV